MKFLEFFNNGRKLLIALLLAVGFAGLPVGVAATVTFGGGTIGSVEIAERTFNISVEELGSIRRRAYNHKHSGTNGTISPNG